MNTKYRTRGFVFKYEDRGEADRSFSVFTEDFGRLEILAKAIRKINSKLRSGIGIFYFSKVEFIQGKSYKTLTDTLLEAKVVGPENFEIASKISQVMDIFLKGQEKDSCLFKLLEEVFGRFSKNVDFNLLYYYFLWNFLSLQGYSPQVDVCSLCRGKLNPYSVYFSAKEGGVVCKKCSFKDTLARKINSDIVKILRIIQKKDLQTLLKLKIAKPSRQMLSSLSENAAVSFCPS